MINIHQLGGRLFLWMFLWCYFFWGWCYPSSIIVKKAFFEKVNSIVRLPEIGDFIERCTNVLVEMDGDEFYLYLSGVKPLMHSSTKNELSRAARVVVRDMFDVVFDDDAQAQVTRNDLYEYLAVKLVKDCAEVIQRSSCKDINRSLRISELRRRLSGIRAFPGIDTQMIDDFIAELTAFVRQTDLSVVNCITNAGKEKFLKTFLPSIGTAFENVEARARVVVVHYLDRLAYYYGSLENVCAEKVIAARFGLQILRRMELSDCIAYVNDPRSIKAKSLHALACSIEPSFSPDSIVDHMSGIVQLSHTEPMFIGIHRLREIPLSPYFFSYRDMCHSCDPLVCAVGIEANIPNFTVFSLVVCTGQGGEESVVDFLYERDGFRRSQMEETIFRGVHRVRVENLQDILTGFGGKNSIQIDFASLTLEPVAEFAISAEDNQVDEGEETE